MRPLIGISLCLDERGRRHPTREYAYLETSYARALADAGATPLLLPIQEDVASLVDRLAGLLIPGGDDFAPPRAYPPEVRFNLAPPASSPSTPACSPLRSRGSCPCSGSATACSCSRSFAAAN